MTAAATSNIETPEAIILSSQKKHIREIVEASVRQTAAEQNKTLPPLDDDLPLIESGLDSLCLAIIVARLEDRLGVDPFSAGDGVTFPVTIGDLIASYERAASN